MSTGAVEVEKEPAVKSSAPPRVPAQIGVTVLTGGFDRPYAFGLTTALASQGVALDVIGSAEVDSPEMHSTPGLTFLNLQGDPREKASRPKRIFKVLRFYARLFRYVVSAKTRVFHILWNNKFPAFDRTLLMLYYKMFGKKIVFTAHNVNAGRRDKNDSAMNRLTLKIQYHLADHIFVHTEKMKSELGDDFGIPAESVTVIPFGINNSVPNSELTSAQAKHKLGLDADSKTILFYGAIRPYKGLEHLVAAFQRVAPKDSTCRLLIAGEVKKGAEQYLQDIQKTIDEDRFCRTQTVQRIEFIPDAETEVYFKAADVLVLPYSEIFQSGVLFLAYSFGLPVIAADIGSFHEDILPGETGFLCKSVRAEDFAETIERYFASDLYKSLASRRPHIQAFTEKRNSWRTVADATCAVYERLLGISA